MVTVIHLDLPFVTKPRRAGNTDVTAQFDLHRAGALVEERGRDEVSGETLADAARIEGSALGEPYRLHVVEQLDRLDRTR